MPNAEDVKRALSTFKRGADYIYFFDHLKSPGWIAPLREAGVLRSPPEPEVTDRTISFPAWPESRYLVRVAAQAPDAVLAVVLSVPTENIRVHADFLDAALAMPPSVAAKMVPSVKKWIRSKYRLLLPDQVGKLMVKLARGDETDAALNLARAILDIRPRPAGDNDSVGAGARLFGQPLTTVVEDWAYQEILREHIPALVEVRGRDTVKLLSALLNRAVGEPARGDTSAWDDYSSAWRPAIEDHSQNLSMDLRSLLVSALRDASEHVVSEGGISVDELVEGFDARNASIFHRLSLHLLARFPDASPAGVRSHLVDRHRFHAPELRHEYSVLLQECFSRLANADRATILSWIDQGPNIESFIERFEASRQRPATLEDIQLRIQYWQRDRLYPIRQSLPPEWSQQYDSLVQQLGLPEHPDFLRFTRVGWASSATPKSSEEMATMSVDEIITFLQRWQPSKGPFDESREGLSQALSGAIALAPDRFASNARHFVGLDPAYVSALLTSLEKAAKDRVSVEWPMVLDLTAWVIQQVDDQTTPGLETEPNWSWSRKATADLLVTALRARTLDASFSLRQRIWDLLRLLVDDPDPTPEHERRFGGSNMDPETLSLNTVRGQAMHAVLEYALWVRRSMGSSSDGPDAKVGFAAMPEVRDVLDRHLDVDIDPSAAIRSVYGQRLPSLLELDPEWTRQSIDRIFSAASEQTALWHASWDAYVIFTEPGDDILGLMSGKYAYAIDRLGKDRPPSRHLLNPDARLAEHLMELYGRGRLTLDDPNGFLGRFFGRADDSLRGHALVYIGEALNGTKGPIAAAILDRCRRLWESRLAFALGGKEPRGQASEVAAFGWWFVSGKFDDEWSASQLLQALRFGHRVNADLHVLERLAELVTKTPTIALECVHQLITVVPRSEPWVISTWSEELREIFDRSIATGDSAVRATVAEIAHELGARGCSEFRRFAIPDI